MCKNVAYFSRPICCRFQPHFHQNSTTFYQPIPTTFCHQKWQNPPQKNATPPRKKKLQNVPRKVLILDDRGDLLRYILGIDHNHLLRACSGLPLESQAAAAKALRPRCKWRRNMYFAHNALLRNLSPRTLEQIRRLEADLVSTRSRIVCSLLAPMFSVVSFHPDATEPSPQSPPW